MTVNKREGLFETIHITITDTFGGIRVEWPDGTIHERALLPGVDTHKVVNLLADALSEHVFKGPELYSAEQENGAGALQYTLDIASEFSRQTSCTFSFNGGEWKICSRLGKVLAINPSIILAINEARKFYK